MNRSPTRKIIHIDMDAYYAAIEQRDHPEWRGKPLVVGGRPDGRGVVSTCSYEARVYGIHSAMPTARAYRLCPHAIFVTEPQFPRYIEESRRIREIFREATDLVEPLSLDEAYLDVTETKLNIPTATGIAEYLRNRIFNQTGLTASAGVSYNKSLSKIASDWRKPNGLTVITPGRAEEFLADLPVGKLWGVGPVTEKRMKQAGISTCRDLRSKALWELDELFGKAGSWYYDLCRGIDDRPVEPVYVRKSLGKERTLPRDLTDLEEIKEILNGIGEAVSGALRESGISGRTITLKVKYADFRQITRSRSAGAPLAEKTPIMNIVEDLLGETEAGSRPVRLLGISVSSLVGVESTHGETWSQLDLAFSA